jgi:hypothetical protein
LSSVSLEGSRGKSYLGRLGRWRPFFAIASFAAIRFLDSSAVRSTVIASPFEYALLARRFLLGPNRSFGGALFLQTVLHDQTLVENILDEVSTKLDLKLFGVCRNELRVVDVDDPVSPVTETVQHPQRV